MPDNPPSPDQHSSLNTEDVLFAIFKHKWMIAIFALIGLVAAAGVYYFYPLVYESDAKLLVRYVLDRSAVDPIESNSASGSNKTTDNVIGSEIEILTSWDLAVEAAKAIGPKRILPEAGDSATVEAAAATISSGLEVVARKGSDIIWVAYKSREPQLATLVLQELVNRYFTKHLEVHRSADAFDFVSQQSDQVRSRLNQTEDALKVLTGKAGIVTLASGTAGLSGEAAKTAEQLHSTEAELAEQRARVKQIEEAINGPSTGPGAQEKSESKNETDVPPAETQKYELLISRLAQLRQSRLDLLSRFTTESQNVQANQAEIDELEGQRQSMAKRFPELASVTAPGSGNGRMPDLLSERAHLAGIEARRGALAKRLAELQSRLKQLSDEGPEIADLERKKEVEEANYKYFQGTLEKARIDEALDPSKMPNISAVQRPSPPARVAGKRNKFALLLAGGGIGLGIAIALLQELILNRTIKRPRQLELQLRTPLLLSIPYCQVNGHGYSRPSLPLGGSATNGIQNGERLNIAPWEVEHFIRPYSEAMRDRLDLFFRLNNMTHKPKLVGLTGFSAGAGTSTLAAGLAAALSEMGDGKVLLVDVNVGSEEIHPFFKGRPAYSLSTALQSSNPIDSAADKLYLATVAHPSGGPMQLALKRLFDLMPNFKASEFDYIIFDMPPFSQTSPTLGMAGFMDKMLLVVEAEANNREVVKRGYAELLSTRTKTSVVFNKARTYGPPQFGSEL